MERRIALRLIGLGALAMMASAQPPPLPRPPEVATKGPTQINSARPLWDAAKLLRNLYAKVVTYEEPVLIWSGDLRQINRSRDLSLKWAIEAKPLAFTMPAETGIEPNLALVLDRTLQSYHQQTTGTRFQVLTSSMGYHIVPVQVHDERGQWVAASSPLDLRVSVSAQERTPVEHVGALLTAIASAGGPLVNPGIQDGRGFNNVFRATPARFQWGVNAVVARDALVDLFQRSATTMLWNLMCQPSAKAEDRFCVLNPSMLTITTTNALGNPINEPLKFDRCTGSCPPLPQPQPLKKPKQ